jgi:hypothetical protein
MILDSARIVAGLHTMSMKPFDSTCIGWRIDYAIDDIVPVTRGPSPVQRHVLLADATQLAPIVSGIKIVRQRPLDDDHDMAMGGHLLIRPVQPRHHKPALGRRLRHRRPVCERRPRRLLDLADDIVRHPGQRNAQADCHRLGEAAAVALMRISFRLAGVDDGLWSFANPPIQAAARFCFLSDGLTPAPFRRVTFCRASNQNGAPNNVAPAVMNQPRTVVSHQPCS